MPTHINGNFVVLNRDQAAVWSELYEAVNDFLLGNQHDKACDNSFGPERDNYCYLCDAVSRHRRERLEAAVKAAGPEAEKIKDMFGSVKK